MLAWDWVSRDDYRHRLNVYDLGNDTWVLQNVTYNEVGMPMSSRLVAADEARLILVQNGRGDAQWVVHELRLGPTVSWDDEPPAFIDGPYVYSLEPGRFWPALVRHPLGAGTTTTFELPESVTEHPMVRDGVITLGTFALSEEEIAKRGGEHPPPWTVEARPLVPVTDAKGVVEREENGDAVEMVPGVALGTVVAVGMLAASGWSGRSRRP